jgi:hypothetical protein
MTYVSPSLDGKRKGMSSPDSVNKHLKREIVMLKARNGDLERQVSLLQDRNDGYESDTYELSCEMRILKKLCEIKISNFELKCQTSKQCDEIKAMVIKNS